MHINPLTCVHCMECIEFCPVNAIHIDIINAYIDQSVCCECGACNRKNVFECPVSSIYQGEITHLKQIAKNFSDPTIYHAKTRVPGRGTEEVKTNDVTGSIKKGEVGIAIEIGRPCLGAKISIIEEFHHALRLLGVHYEINNPLSNLIEKPKGNCENTEFADQQLISAIIQFNIPLHNLGNALKAIISVSETIETVFSMSLITQYEPGQIIPSEIDQALLALNLKYRPNAKVNLGLGKPLYKE